MKIPSSTFKKIIIPHMRSSIADSVPSQLQISSATGGKVFFPENVNDSEDSSVKTLVRRSVRYIGGMPSWNPTPSVILKKISRKNTMIDGHSPQEPIPHELLQRIRRNSYYK